MKAAYPFGEQKSSYAEMKRPNDKTFEQVKSAELRGHSEFKPVQKKYWIVNEKNISELNK